MKPRDLIKVTYPNGVSHFWEVEGIFLGALNQESVVELKAVNQITNTQGRTLCPAAMLDVLASGGSLTVYDFPEVPSNDSEGFSR